MAAGCFLAFHFSYTVLQVVSLLTEVTPAFVDLDALRISTAFNGLLDGALVLFLATHCWHVRRGRPPGRLFPASTLALALFTLAIWCLHLHMGGSQSSHMVSLVLGTLVVVSWILSARVVLGLAVVATLGIGLVSALEATGILPYAPLLIQEAQDAAMYYDPRVFIMNGVITLCALGVPVWIALEMQRSLRQSQEILEASLQRLREEVAEREAAQNTLRRSLEELGAANEGLRTFFQSVAHDLRSPLTAIGGFATLLEAREAREGGRRHTERILASVQHMSLLLDDLTSLVEGGRREAPLVPVSLEEELEAVLGLVEGQLGPVGGLVEHGPLPVVLADAHLLRRVLQNLLSNAIKFRSEERPLRVRIDAEPAPASLGRSVGGAGGPLWVISVRDNGMGFDPKEAERVFQPFERLVGKEPREGHGLGLSICRVAVQAMGGRIWVEPVPGTGATFRFTLGRVDSPSP